VAVGSAVLLPLLLDHHDPSQLLSNNDPDEAGGIAICHDSSRSFMRYGHCQGQGTMGIATSRAESFTRVRDVPLSQNQGIRYPPSSF
jgi:hypothetical protein